VNAAPRPAASPASPVAAQGSGRNRLSAAVAIVIAFATFVAAVTAFLQADAANLAGDRRGEAEELSLQALASSQSSRETSQVELETFQQWVEQRTNAGNALLASIYATNDPVRQNSLLLEQERWETIAAATLKQSALDPESEFGPENDPTFPRRYFAAATEESTRLNALQDAANEEASKLDARAAGYTAILATLAVALYLFGLTLAVSSRGFQLGFLGVGLLLLSVAVVWMVQTAFVPVYQTNDDAASEYAKGRVAAATAFDQAGYKTAEDHYTRAIQLRPTYGRAYVERASAIFLGASPQRTGFASIAPPEALARATTDLKSAVALGMENASTLAQLGFYTFAGGVQSADLKLVDQSIDFTRRAIILDPSEPVYRFNLAVAMTAAGRFDEARNAYQDGVLTTIYVDPTKGELRQEPLFEEQVLAGALTDLEIVRRYEADLEPVTGRQGFESQILEFKQHLVGRVTVELPDPPVASPAVFANITLDVFPAELQWQGDVQNYDPTRDTISAQWYHNDPEGHGWAVIPEVSQTSTPSVDANGRLFQLTAYTGNVTPADCLPPGSYRVELFVNGRLAAEAQSTPDFGDFDAFMARDLTAAYCRPHDWVRREDRLPGLIDGYQSPDGTYGAYLARYNLPGSLRNIDDVAAQIEDVTVESFATWFPVTPTYDEASGTTDDYFMGLDRRAWRWYDYGTGSVRVGAGVTPDGAVIVGMVYGPNDWFNGPEPQRIIDSMIRVQ
jgi:tetratricopeptide (TPR) repeat protein